MKGTLIEEGLLTTYIQTNIHTSCPKPSHPGTSIRDVRTLRLRLAVLAFWAYNGVWSFMFTVEVADATTIPR